MPSTTTDGKEGWSDQMLAEEEARQAFKSSGRTTRSPNKKAALPSLRIPAAPKKPTVRSTIEENENDEPGTPSPKPTIKPVEIASMIEVLEPASNPMKMLMQTAISMIKRSRNKLNTPKLSAPLKEEVYRLHGSHTHNRGQHGEYSA